MFTKKFTFIVLLFIIASHVAGQTYNSPESVVFDKNANRYLVSNVGSGAIISRSLTGALSYFKTGLTDPKGMCIHGNIVYVTDNKFVKGYLLSNGGMVMNINISSAGSLNDIVWADGYLYVGDMYGDKIYKINTVNKTYSVFASTGLNSPNGLLYDKYNNRLIAVSYTSNAKIYGINLTSKAVSVIRSTTYTNLDGITKDENGNIYISTWGSNAILKYDSTFSSTPDTFSYLILYPADIYYNREAKVLAAPSYGNNQVVFYNFLSPTITAGGPLTICPGTTVQLSTVSGTALSYTWKRNGYVHSTSASILANMTGDYAVTVSNHVGSVTSDTVHVTVLGQPAKPSINYSGSISFCHGDSIILHAPPGFTAYKWSDNDTSSTKIVKSRGSFHLFVYDTNLCASPASDPVTITVGPSVMKPAITDSGNTTMCHGDTAYLSGPAGFNYHWSTGDTTQHIAVTQTKSVFLAISDTAGCWSNHSDTVDIHVLSPPAKPVISVNGHTSFCHGDSVELSVPVGPYTFHWNDGDSVHSKIIRQSGHLAVMITDSNGCRSAWSDTVDVQAFPLPPKPVIHHGHTHICQGDSAYLQVPFGYDHYYWHPGGSGHFELFAKHAGFYKVMVQDTNGCFSPFSDSIEIKTIPSPAKPVIGYSEDTFCSGDTAIATAPAGYDAYIWSNGDSSHFTLILHSSLIKLRVVDSNGCISPASDSVHFVMVERPETPVITLLTGDTLYASTIGDQYHWMFNDTLLNEHSQKIKGTHKGYYKVSIISGRCASYFSTPFYFIPSSLDAPLKSVTLIYPNPSDGQFYVQIPDKLLHQNFRIMDIMARQVIQGEFIQRVNLISGLTKGVYLLIINTPSGQFYKKVMIR